MAKKQKKMIAVPIGKDMIGISFTEQQGDYLNAIVMVKEIVEALTKRNMESFSLEETIKIRPITLPLTKMLSDRKIRMDNFEKHKKIITELCKIAAVKLKEAGVIK